MTSKSSFLCVEQREYKSEKGGAKTVSLFTQRCKQLFL